MRMATCGRTRTLLTRRLFSSMTPRPLQSIELRGAERFFGSIDNNSATVAVTIHVNGPVQPMLDRVHQAFANTMNKHPRLRVKQSPTDSTKAFVYPKVSVDTVRNEEYVKVVHVDDEHQWQQLIQEETEIPFDRVSRFPCYLHVLVNPKRNDSFSLVIYGDHYQVDGGAVNVMFDSILQEASKPDLNEQVEERPLPESLFNVWGAQNKWKLLAAETFAKLFAPTLMQRMVRSFKPSLPPAPTLNDFDVYKPLVPNKTHGMWQTGSHENMLRSLARCREEKVTLQGAFIASIVAVFAEATKKHKQKENPIKMIFKYAVNARGRVPVLKSDDVGCFATGGELASLSKEGVSLSARFWDVARRTKKETEANMSTTETLVKMCFLDELARLASPESKSSSSSSSKSLVYPKGINGDVGLSNLGRYPYQVKHEVNRDAARYGTWQIQNYFCYCSAPTISSSLVFWMTCVGNRIDYSLAHKLDESIAQHVFTNAVKLFERIGEIDEHETLEQVVQRMLVANA